MNRRSISRWGWDTRETYEVIFGKETADKISSALHPELPIPVSNLWVGSLALGSLKT